MVAEKVSVSEVFHTVITGDSFGAGEWSESMLSHGGVSQYLYENGYSASNISQPGAALSWLILPLRYYLTTNVFLNIKKVVFFQTDICRDLVNPVYKNRLISLSIEFPNKSVKDLIDLMYKDFYQQLQNLAQEFDVEVLMVGGLTDIVSDLGEFDRLTVAVPSMMADESVIQPVRLMGAPDAWAVLDEIFKHRKQELLELMEEQYQRHKYFKKTPRLFNDQFHPNRIIHHNCYTKIIKYL